MINRMRELNRKIQENKDFGFLLLSANTPAICPIKKPLICVNDPIIAVAIADAVISNTYHMIRIEKILSPICETKSLITNIDMFLFCNIYLSPLKVIYIK
jgi:hypothetical protein